jgi:hypothetical protein
MSRLTRVVAAGAMVAVLAVAGAPRGLGCPVVAASRCAGSKGSPRLTAEGARRALIELARQRSQDDEFQAELRSLRNDRVQRVDAQAIQIGEWRINLRRRSFFIIFPRRYHYHVSGKFRRTAGNKWKAVISRELIE